MATFQKATSKAVSSRGAAGPDAYTLWEYQSGAWAVLKSGHAEGYHPGDPPGRAGRFEGEIVRKFCEPVLGPAPETPVSP